MFNVGNCFFIRIQHLHPNCIGVRPHCASLGLFQIHRFSSKHLPTISQVLSVAHSITVKRRFCSSVLFIIYCHVCLSSAQGQCTVHIAYSAPAMFTYLVAVSAVNSCLRCHQDKLSRGCCSPEPFRDHDTESKPNQCNANYNPFKGDPWNTGPLMTFFKISWSGWQLFNHFSMKNCLILVSNAKPFLLNLNFFPHAVKWLFKKCNKEEY